MHKWYTGQGGDPKKKVEEWEAVKVIKLNCPNGVDLVFESPDEYRQAVPLMNSLERFGDWQAFDTLFREWACPFSMARLEVNWAVMLRQCRRSESFCAHCPWSFLLLGGRILRLPAVRLFQFSCADLPLKIVTWLFLLLL